METFRAKMELKTSKTSSFTISRRSHHISSGHQNFSDFPEKFFFSLIWVHSKNTFIAKNIGNNVTIRST